MRSITKVTSEPNLFGTKGKTFAPVKRASITRPSDAYKLSSKVKNILSNELKSPPSYGGCGDDSGIQSMNPRRKFQRRGSKSASMFKAFSSIDHFDIPDSLFENIRNKNSNSRTNMCLESVVQIQRGSERSCLSAMEESALEDTSESTDSDEFACSYS